MTREEAIKEIKSWDFLNEKETEAIETLIPELCESEDERTKKWILEYLYDGLHKSDEQFKQQFKSAIAWLEKQKEQKVDIDKLRKDIYQSGYNDGYQHGKEDAQKEQKPAEWSDEDEKILNLAIEWAETMSGQFSFVDMDSTDFHKIIAWLKSLKNRGNFPKSNTNSPSWSEEDERMRQTAIEACKTVAADYENSNARFYKCKEWLKSLRPQPHWKPSKEQMKALKEDADQYWEMDGCDPLYTLYQDLKKL